MGMFNDLKNITEQGAKKPPPPQTKKEQEQQKPNGSDTASPSKEPVIKKASTSASDQASSNARALANSREGSIEEIRKTVKRLGKEVTFIRLTPEEKAQLADIVYAYKRRGTKTSENEIGRIGLNYLIADYLAHGEESVLAKVIAALNA